MYQELLQSVFLLILFIIIPVVILMMINLFLMFCRNSGIENEMNVEELNYFRLFLNIKRITHLKTGLSPIVHELQSVEIPISSLMIVYWHFWWFNVPLIWSPPRSTLIACCSVSV